MGDSGLYENCHENKLNCTSTHFIADLEYNTKTNKAGYIVIGSIYSFTKKTEELNDSEMAYSLLKMQKKNLKTTEQALIGYYGKDEMKRKYHYCDRNLRKLLVERKTEEDCEKELESRVKIIKPYPKKQIEKKKTIYNPLIDEPDLY